MLKAARAIRRSDVGGEGFVVAGSGKYGAELGELVLRDIVVTKEDLKGGEYDSRGKERGTHIALSLMRGIFENHLAQGRLSVDHAPIPVLWMSIKRRACLFKGLTSRKGEKLALRLTA